MAPEIVIQLVLYRERDFLPGLVRSLRAQTFTDFKTFALDNASDDDTGQLFKHLYPEGNLMISNENLGFAGGHNFLWQHTKNQRAPYLLILNTDVLLHEDFLKHLYRLLQSDKSIGAAGPVVYEGNADRENPVIQNYRLYMNFKKATKHSPDAGQLPQLFNRLPSFSEVDYLSGVAMLLKTSVIEDIGFFEKKLFMYGEERDFFYRFRKKGFRAVVTQSAICWHLHDWTGGDSMSIRREYYYLRRNKILYFKKYELKVSLCRFLLLELLKMPIVLLWSIRKGGLPMFYFYWLGILHGLRGKTGKGLS